mgnify:CR=1 FL=1
MNEPDPNLTQSSDTGLNEMFLDLDKIRRQLLANWVLVLGIVAGITFVAIAYAMLATPVYRSEILLASTASEQDGNQLAGLLGQIAPTSSTDSLSATIGKDQAVAILRSRAFTAEFIEKANLRQIIFADLWDEANQAWLADSAEEIPTLSKAVSVFDDSIRTVNEDLRRNLITLRIDWTDPNLAAEWANRLVEQLNEHLRQRDIAEAQRSIEFLNAELERSGVIELRQGMYRLIESQIESVMLANVRKEYAFTILDPAVPAENPIRPKRRSIAVLGLAVGFVLGVFAGLVRTPRRQKP